MIMTRATAAEGVKPPLQNVQFLASQAPIKRKKGEAPLLAASFRLTFQTRKG
jgi:hypothetical protein